MERNSAFETLFLSISVDFAYIYIYIKHPRNWFLRYKLLIILILINYQIVYNHVKIIVINIKIICFLNLYINNFLLIVFLMDLKGEYEAVILINRI